MKQKVTSQKMGETPRYGKHEAESISQTILFNYRRLRVFVGEDCILDDVLYNPIICEGCTWTYNERNRKLEISLTKDSDTIVWCAAFLAKDAEGNVPLDYEEEAAERERMERFLPKRF